MKKLISFCLILLLWLATPMGFAHAQDIPGEFDYYLLALSWSPEYCYRRDDSTQCGDRRYGFVVHGLWPQYEEGYPQYCGGNPNVPEDVIQEMLPIMPSRELINHEWEKHGTCTGLSVEDYFALTRELYYSVDIPDEYKNLNDYKTTNVISLEEDLINENPDLTNDGIAIICKRRKRYFQEARICYDKDLDPRNCSSEVRDTCGSLVVLRPIREGMTGNFEEMRQNRGEMRRNRGEFHGNCPEMKGNCPEREENIGTINPLLNDGDVEISSALINPENPEQGKEWVILTNTTDNIIDLSGWKIQDGKGRNEVITGKIPPESEIQIVFSGISIRLTNSGGSITLLNDRGKMVSEVSYSRASEGIPVEF